jgi:hypothetical protein
MRFLLAVSLVCLAVRPLAADQAEVVARIHVEAIGGAERIAALATLRATGLVAAGGKMVRFTMIAARPNKVRLETEADGRMLVQATDGVEPPWEFDTGVWPPNYRRMAESVAKTFVSDAEFDDPLVAGATGGYRLDFAGEIEADGRSLLRLLVTRKFTETFSLLLDPETYLILNRIETRTTAGGRKLNVVTHYQDFRPVSGVLLPHQVTVAVDGRATQQTKILKIEANPRIEDGIFSLPKIPAADPSPR